MLLAALFLFQVHLTSALSDFDCTSNPYGTSTNGKLVHNMRTFVNVTFDWNSRDADVVIPECHEKKIRMSYFEIPTDMFTHLFLWPGQQTMQAGHLVYPLVLKVDNGTSRRHFYAAAVFKIIANLEEDLKGWSAFTTHSERNKRFTQLTIICENTWTLIWNRWKSVIKEGKDLCDGGRAFDNMLDRIYSDAKIKPQYDDIVHENYTDLTSDVCLGTSCEQGPIDNAETLMLAYPSAEGIEQIKQSSTCCSKNSDGPVYYCIQYYSHSRFRDFMVDYYDRKRGKGCNTYTKCLTWEAAYIRASNCVFSPPFC